MSMLGRFAAGTQTRGMSATIVLGTTLALSIHALGVSESGVQELQPKSGEPVLNLTLSQLERFEHGKLLYGTPITIEEGQGPILNKSNCRSCHTNPDGGSGSIAVVHFGMEEKGEFIPLPGGSLFQLVAIGENCREVIPPEANFTTTHVTPGMMGYGLVEAIPDADIVAIADPTDANGDGVSGRVHWVQPAEDPTGPLRVGRFGWKSIVATILTFSGDASMNELGLTNALFPEENAPNGDIELRDMCDDVADPEDHADEDGFTFIERVTDFQRYMAAPPQTPRSGMTGEALFASIGCAQCHVQTTFITSNDPSLEDALRNKPVKPYSDFLLHDMGTLGDGLPQGDAYGNEFRTTPLMGIRDRELLLHNGSVAGGTFESRIINAIAAHGPLGEAATSASAFAALSANEKDSIVSFLDSLGRREFDFNGDREIDVLDFTIFASCYSIDVVHMPDDVCAIDDVDQDGDVDDVDLSLFLQAYEAENGDCDCNGMSDLEEILAGASDKDNNGVPDECVPCDGDFNCDNVVDGGDLGTLLTNWGQCSDCPADLNSDNLVDGADLGLFLIRWGQCP